MTSPIKKSQIYLFHGEDTFTSFRKVESWKARFAVKYGSSAISCIDVESWTGSEDELLGLCKKMIVQQSLFHSSALIIIKNLFSSKLHREPLGIFLLEYLPVLHPATFVLLMEGTIDKRLSLYKSFCALEKKEVVRIETFDIPHGDALLKWIDLSLNELQTSMTERARMAFCNRFDPPRSFRAAATEQESYDLWLLWNELHKLTSYASCRPITHDDVSLLCQITAQAHIFESMDMFTRKDVKNTIECIYKLLTEHLHDASSSLGICSFFQNQLHGMLIIKDMLACGQSEQHIALALDWKNERVRIVARQIRPLSLNFLKRAALSFIKLEQLLKSRPVPAGSILLHTIEQALAIA